MKVATFLENDVLRGCYCSDFTIFFRFYLRKNIKLIIQFLIEVLIYYTNL